MLKLFKKKQNKNETGLDDLLKDFELPSFPEAVMQVMSLLRQPESSTREIISLLEMDPGMHAKVLKTVNSASFGIATEVTSVQHAVGLLGRSRLEAIVVAIAVHSSMPPVDARGFDAGRFWLTSAQRASLARALSIRLHPTTQAESFTAGLLQDMGVPVLASAQSDTYGDLYARWKQAPDQSLSEMEREVFGYDHAQVGSKVARLWKLPEFLVNSISTHHDADSDEHVNAAVQLVSPLCDGADDFNRARLIDLCRDRHGLDEETIAGDYDTALEHAREFHKLLQ
jgi:HD-like signal output (HDOD) protein